MTPLGESSGTPSQLDRLKVRLAGINSTAGVVVGDHGQIAPGRLFNLTAMRESVTSDELSDWLGVSNSNSCPLAGPSGLTLKTPATHPMASLEVHAHHDSRIGSASIEVDAPIPADVFDFWLDTLIALKGPDILRIKGIVHVEGIEWPFVFCLAPYIRPLIFGFSNRVSGACGRMFNA